VGKVEWIAAAEQMPDAEMCVLLALEDGEVWPGFFDGDHGWRYLDAGRVDIRVIFWADFPVHPRTN